jgi:hypothetical protein
MAVGEIIVDDRLETFVGKIETCMRPDIAGTTHHKNRFTRHSLFLSLNISTRMQDLADL